MKGISRVFAWRSVLILLVSRFRGRAGQKEEGWSYYVILRTLAISGWSVCHPHCIVASAGGL